MLKHALMLTAATMALTAGTAAYADTLITTTKTAAQTTSADGNITLGQVSGTTTTNGYVTVTIANPAIEINSANTVTIATASSTISNNNTTGAIGIQLDATGTTPNGVAGADSVYSTGIISLAGTGTGKYGILITPAPGDTSTTTQFNGNINLLSGSQLTVTGDSSIGIFSKTGTVLNGNIDIHSTVIVNPTSTVLTTGGQVIGIDLAGQTGKDAGTGNLFIDTGGAVEAYGEGAKAVIVTGHLLGNITNEGTISSIGTSTAASTITNPEGGTALTVTGSVDGGIYNAGPLTGTDTTARGLINTSGNAPAVVISSSAAGVTATGPVVIGTYLSQFKAAGYGTATDYSFVNRGTIQARPLNPDETGTYGIDLQGGSGLGVNFTGGLYNAGVIQAAATTDSKATSTIAAGGIAVGDYVTLPILVNDKLESNGGTISASISGAHSAQAVGITIGKYGNLAQLVNNGTIAASATSTDLTITNPLNSGTTVLPGLSAYAIQDLSGTLLNVNNSGAISASTTTLNDNSQVAVALDLSAATKSITLTNTGTIAGDVSLGSGSDTITINGTSTAHAAMTGALSLGGGQDILNIGPYGDVTGAVTESNGGKALITVGDGLSPATLNLTNITQGLTVNGLTVNDTSTLGVSVAQAFNINGSSYTSPLISEPSSGTGNITLSANSKFNLTYQTFISATNGGASKFILLDAPNGKLIINNFSAIQSAVAGTGASSGKVPFLYTGAVCTYNVADLTNCDNSAVADSQLVLTLTPKSAADLGLGVNASRVFSYANAALATDNTLGAAFVSDITTAAQAQAAYAAFVPDVSGASRAVVISITDQATGPVGARQRALRMYANKPGETTMWGQEFFQRIASGNDTDGYRGSGFGFAIGADTGSSAAGRYGAAFTFFSGDQTNKAANYQKTINQWYVLTGYTDWRGKGVFFDSQLSVGYGKLDGRRYLDLTNASGATYQREAQSHRPGLTLAGGISTGVILTYGGTVITPQLSLDGMTLREDGYTETGGGSGITGQDGLDLTVQPYYANSARAYLGISMRQDVAFDDFYLQPELRAGYRYDVLAKAVKLKAAFAVLPNDQFTLYGPDPEKGNAVVGGSLAVSTGTWSLGVNYDYIHGSNGLTDQTGTITLLGRI